jgi:hypothetical protein
MSTRYFDPNKPLLFFTYKKALKMIRTKEVPTICPAFGKLLSLHSIDEEQYEIVVEHFHANKPSKDKFRGIFYHPHFTNSSFWWTMPYSDQSKLNESRGQRINYMKELIKSVRPNPIELLVYWFNRLWYIMFT